MLVCEDPLEGLRWMDGWMKTVGLENDACQPQGPKSLRLTTRLETLKRSGLFLVDLDFYNRVKARVLRGRGARLSGSNAADGIAGRPRLENGVPESQPFKGC